MTAIAFFIAIGLGLVHVFGAYLSFLGTEPRSRWLSAGAGATVAFLFMYLLPELSDFRELLAGHDTLGLIDELTHLLALAGVAVFYALEHFAFYAREASDDTESDVSHDYVFWIHIGWYALYNIIIGLLLLYGDQQTGQGLALYGVAMAIHFFIVDASMRHHHQHVYHATGRWILGAAVVAGWMIGALIPLSLEFIAASTAFLIGGMLITAVKDELPARRETRLAPFLFSASFTALFLVIL